MNWQVLDRMPFLPQPKRDLSPPRTEPGMFYLLNESVSSNIKLHCIKTVGGYCIDFYDSIKIFFLMEVYCIEILNRISTILIVSTTHFTVASSS